MRRAVLLLVIAFAAAACGNRPGAGGGASPPTSGGVETTAPTSGAMGTTAPTSGPGTSAPTSGPATTPPTSGSLGTVVVTQDFDRSGGLYVEGSYSFIRLARDGTVVFHGRLKGDQLRRELPAGTYTLSSYQRPCDGNCGYLDPPTDRCSEQLTVVAGDETHVHITVRAGEGCTFDDAATTAPA